ncbi:FAD-dependent oxidoreductase [Mesorhizobium sp. WSM2239]|uniref:Tryptophan 2-monooxygenase n=2 Tax=unclassified Mesorhizobium TaxID=325217 RepID=A0AAU8DA48_9HYPH
MKDVDVVVVGAGSAGLAAAKTLRAAGLSFTVLEAMNRVGGRAWTSTEHFGIPFDIGCAWIHAADRNPYFAEAEAAGWTLHYHDMNVDHLYYGKRKASEEEEAEMKRADCEMSAALEKWSGTDDSVSLLLASGHAPRAAATFAGPMDFGQDYDEVSIEDFRAAADLDPNYFTREGFGALVAQYGADVPVQLSTPVRKILWDVSGVACVTDRGTIRARAVIVTASPAVLAFEEIEFSPALPDAVVEAFFDLPMGMLTKRRPVRAGRRRAPPSWNR